MKFGYKKELPNPFADVLRETNKALTRKRFGVVSRIDAKAIFKEKLGIHTQEYIILGVCHAKPALAMLETDKELGLLLPCNVVIYQEGDHVTVNAMMPVQMLAMTDYPHLKPVAFHVEEKLKKVVDHVYNKLCEK